ncbi:Dph7 [Scenedesmus sp. PABB004]|nr:Dph7 [Scenedesmus sp. PABB004]
MAARDDGRRHAELLLPLHADAAEFCAAPGAEAWLGVGTYQLDEATATRHGRLHLLALAELGQLPGIFDLQWACLPAVSAAPCIGLALADGSLRLVAVRTGAGGRPAAPGGGGGGEALAEVSRCAAAGDGAMALALDWAGLGPRQEPREPQQPAVAAVAGSDGGVSVLQLDDGGVPRRVAAWRAHELETWMAVWDRHAPHVLYSGADDAAFKGWDARAACAAGAAGEEAPQQAPTFVNRRAHGAGVTCIACHPRRPGVLATGSYDEAARLWDVRQLARPLETCRVETGGGVWRLKWHPRDDRRLLAACMYNGFALLRADEAWGGLQARRGRAARRRAAARRAPAAAAPRAER